MQIESTEKVARQVYTGTAMGKLIFGPPIDLHGHYFSETLPQAPPPPPGELVPALDLQSSLEK